MTTQTIPQGSNSATFTYGIGSYRVTAVAGKYATISQTFDITQSDIENGSKTVNLGAMEFGTHTFNVTVASDDDGEFTVKLYNGTELVDTKTTIDKATSFTVTATEHSEDAVDYRIDVIRSGYKTVSEIVEATQAEFRLNSGESVEINAGSNVVTLTVTVVADTAVSVTVQ